MHIDERAWGWVYHATAALALRRASPPCACVAFGATPLVAVIVNVYEPVVVGVPPSPPLLEFSVSHDGIPEVAEKV